MLKDIPLGGCCRSRCECLFNRIVINSLHRIGLARELLSICWPPIYSWWLTESIVKSGKSRRHEEQSTYYSEKTSAAGSNRDLVAPNGVSADNDNVGCAIAAQISQNRPCDRCLWGGQGRQDDTWILERERVHFIRQDGQSQQQIPSAEFQYNQIQ